MKKKNNNGKMCVWRGEDVDTSRRATGCDKSWKYSLRAGCRVRSEAKERLEGSQIFIVRKFTQKSKAMSIVLTVY